MRLDAVIAVLRGVADEGLAADWDEVGLQVGDRTSDVESAVLCIDLTEAVLAEAVKAGAELIVAYHPLLFRPVARLVGADWKQRVVAGCVREGIAVYSPHTALDAAVGGINDWLCDGMAGANAERVPIEGTALGTLRKVVTFVPEDAVEAVRAAMSGAGAGCIGGYDQCSFSVSGEGTFRGGEGTSPAVGKAGRLERVAERRLEMVTPGSVVTAVIDAMRAAHPYEEVAFDVYALAAETAPPAMASGAGAGAGAGRVVTLPEPVTVDALAARVREVLGVTNLDVAAPPPAAPPPSEAGGPNERAWIERVGVCPGAGGSLVKAARALGADAFVTGEMRHHDVLDAAASGVAVVLAGHTETERPYLPVYRDRLAAATGDAVRWVISDADRPPACRG